MNYKKRKAVSEIVATLILVGVTVTGAALVATIFQNSSLVDMSAIMIANTGLGESIKIIGYDTRDSNNLTGISFMDNVFTGPSGSLKTTASAANCPNAPNAGSPGNEFIILKIKNISPNPIQLKSIVVNDVDHLWKTETSSTQLNVAPFDCGTFSIIPISGPEPLMKSATSLLNSNDEVRLVIKLNRVYGSDILPGTLRIQFLTDKLDRSIFAIPTGSAK